MPKILSTRPFFDPEFSARCALFGPGIESARTKHLVHRIVNARDDLFEAVEFVSGLPGLYNGNLAYQDFINANLTWHMSIAHILCIM